MDFPGTINNDFEHFMHHVLDITKSLAYHGFKKIILLNGHGSNMPNLDLVARRTNLETDAECMLRRVVEPADGGQDVPAAAGGRASSPAAARTPASWRRRCTCTSTATTSARTRSRAATISFNEEDSPFNWVDLFAAGPATVISWTSSYSDTGVLGEAELATRREGPAGLRGGGQAARALRDLVQGPAEGRPQGPPPQAADDADPVGAAADCGADVPRSRHEDRRPPPHRACPAAPSRAAGPRNSRPRTTSTPSSRSSPTRASSASAARSPAAPSSTAAVEAAASRS